MTNGICSNLCYFSDIITINFVGVLAWIQLSLEGLSNGKPDDYVYNVSRLIHANQRNIIILKYPTVRFFSRVDITILPRDESTTTIFGSLLSRDFSSIFPRRRRTNVFVSSLSAHHLSFIYIPSRWWLFIIKLPTWCYT